MRNDLLAAIAAGLLLVGLVFLLGDATGLMFGRHGPFDLLSVEEDWSAPDGTLVTSRSEVVTFRGNELFTIRSYDGNLPPDLRSAPIPDSLNRVARTIGEGGSTPRIIADDVPGLDIAIVRRDALGSENVLIRVTPDDAATERTRGDTAASVEVVAERWRSALEQALRFVADSVAATSRPSGR